MNYLLYIFSSDIISIINEYCFIETIIFDIDNIQIDIESIYKNIIHYDEKFDSLYKNIKIILNIPKYGLKKFNLKLFINSNIFFTNLNNIISYSKIKIIKCLKYNCDLNSYVYCSICSKKCNVDLKMYCKCIHLSKNKIHKNSLDFCLTCNNYKDIYYDKILLIEINKTLNKMLINKTNNNILFLSSILYSNKNLKYFINDKGFLLNNIENNIDLITYIILNNDHSEFLTKQIFNQFSKIEKNNSFIMKNFFKIKFNMKNILKIL